MNIDEIYGAYLRMRRALSALVETGIDYGLAELDEFERDLLVLDAGTFLLLFGVLEQSLRGLAVARAVDERSKDYFLSRECKLDRVIAQLQLEQEIKNQIFQMAKIRDDAAHGHRLAGSFNLDTLFTHIKNIDDLASGAAA